MHHCRQFLIEVGNQCPPPMLYALYRQPHSNLAAKTFHRPWIDSGHRCSLCGRVFFLVVLALIWINCRPWTPGNWHFFDHCQFGWQTEFFCFVDRHSCFFLTFDLNSHFEHHYDFDLLWQLQQDHPHPPLNRPVDLVTNHESHDCHVGCRGCGFRCSCRCLLCGLGCGCGDRTAVATGSFVPL